MDAHRIVLRYARFAWLPAAAASLVACGAGSGEGLNISGRPVAEGGIVPLAPTLASVQANVFDPSCIVCHSGAGAPQGLRLDHASSFVSLVGVPSSENGSLLRVDPGNPDRSYLIQKLEGTASEGERMPIGAPAIPQSTIDFVRQWISDGAQPDMSTAPGDPPVVVSLTPAPDSIVADFPAQIVAGFDQEIDASTVNALTFTLVRSGGDGIFDDGDDIALTPASVELSPVNPRLAVMDPGGIAAPEDRYRVVLKGDGPGLILSVSGVALDGDFEGVLPSGDGVQGGDFTAEFELRGIQPTLTSIQRNVFTPTCAVAGCHTGPTGPNLPGGMNLNSDNASFASLVNVPSLQDPQLLRIAPGDADASYLIRKLEGTADTGATMPAGGTPLDPATIAAIRQWIDDGAMP
jgi:hypothetical protein